MSASHPTEAPAVGQPSVTPAPWSPGLPGPAMRRIGVQSLAGAVVIAAVTYGLCFLIPPTFTARTTFITPQQQQNPALSALASIGALSGLAGGALGTRTTADQYVSLMQSNAVSDRLVERFKLRELYDVKYLSDARRTLADRSRVWAGKRDGLITVEVDDRDPERAAQIANAYVEELHTLSNGLALSEAQQRRKFFEAQWQQARKDLAAAQARLQSTGFTAAALRATPASQAEAYGRTRAAISAAEVQLSLLRQRLSPDAPEVQAQQTALATLRAQLAAQERESSAPGADQDYVGALREFKYQEVLSEIYARQFEAARVDEAREGTLIQVVDRATPPERRSKPQRLLIAGAAFIVALVVLPAVLVLRSRLRLAGRGAAR